MFVWISTGRKRECVILGRSTVFAVLIQLQITVADRVVDAALCISHKTDNQSRRKHAGYFLFQLHLSSSICSNSPRESHRNRDHAHRHPIARLQTEEMHHISMEIAPIAHHRKTVITHARHPQRVRHARNGGRAVHVAVLLVVRLMEALQPPEVVAAPRFAGDGPGER